MERPSLNEYTKALKAAGFEAAAEEAPNLYRRMKTWEIVHAIAELKRIQR